MYFDIDQLDGARSYKLMTSTVVPRPIAWVVTINAAGNPNAAPFSFFNCFSGAPPVLCLGIGPHENRRKDTLANIEAQGEFVVNLVPEELAAAMNVTAVDFPHGWNELETAGLATSPSEKISVPRITASTVAFECRHQQTVDIESVNRLVVARVVGLHVDDAAVIDRDRCHVDSAKLRLIGRMQSPGGYVRTTDTFTLRQRSYADWKKAQS